LNRLAALVVAALIVAGSVSHRAAAASFDCAKAIAPSDKAICANPTLSAKDDKLGRLYGQRGSELQSQGGNVQAFVADGRRWLAMRTACTGNAQCLNMWFDERIAALTPSALVPNPAPSSSSPAFKQGQIDRQNWESWFAGVTGDYHAGAEYWATHRSDQHPPSCGASPPSTSADWTAGCYAAQQKLAETDLRRKAEPDYRKGWNALPSVASRLVVNPETPTPRFPPLTGRVVDEAGLLSPRAKAEITGWLAQFEAATKRQVVIATVKSLQGLPIADYGYQLGRFWGIGQKDKNTGAILLAAPTEHKVRIEVGYGLEGELTNAISSTIINQDILPFFRQGNYEQGIAAGVVGMLRALGWTGARNGAVTSTSPTTSTTPAAAPSAFVPSMKVAVTPTNPPVFVGSTNLPEGTGIYLSISCAHWIYGVPGCYYLQPAGSVHGGRFRAEVKLDDGAAKMRPDTYEVEFSVNATAAGASAAEIAALGKQNEKIRGPEVFLLQLDVPGGREVRVPNDVPPPLGYLISYIHELHIVVPPNDKSFAVSQGPSATPPPL
jgi:uncharacterized protein